MHICYLSSSFSRYDPLFYERQGLFMVENGFQVTIIVNDNLPNEERNGIKFISLRRSSLNRFYRFLLIPWETYKLALKIKADIYQISEPSLILVGNLLTQKKNNVVFNLREDYTSIIMTKEYIPRPFRKPVSLILEKLMTYSFKKYGAVFCVTDSLVKKTSQKWNCNSYLITNFPNVNKNFSLSFEEYEKRPNLLCYIGTIYRISRQEVVFKALEQIKEIKYLIAGKIWGSYKNELMNLAYWNKVEFIDGFKKEELHSLYSRATISNVLRDFSKTGTPDGSTGVIKIYESMEAALPILCSDVPLYKRMVAKYKCGICVDPNNQTAVEDAIKYLMLNKEVAYRMGQNGRKAIIDEYNWEKQAVKYKNIIERIISSNGKRFLS